MIWSKKGKQRQIETRWRQFLHAEAGSERAAAQIGRGLVLDEDLQRRIGLVRVLADRVLVEILTCTAAAYQAQQLTDEHPESADDLAEGRELLASAAAMWRGFNLWCQRCDYPVAGVLAWSVYKPDRRDTLVDPILTAILRHLESIEADPLAIDESAQNIDAGWLNSLAEAEANNVRS